MKTRSKESWEELGKTFKTDWKCGVNVWTPALQDGGSGQNNCLVHQNNCLERDNTNQKTIKFLPKSSWKLQLEAGGRQKIYIVFREMKKKKIIQKRTFRTQKDFTFRLNICIKSNNFASGRNITGLLLFRFSNFLRREKNPTWLGWVSKKLYNFKKLLCKNHKNFVIFSRSSTI